MCSTADSPQENLPETPDSRAKSTEHVLRQAKMSRELQELNQMLTRKQELANKMNRSEEEMASVRTHYEVGLCARCAASLFGVLGHTVRNVAD